MKSRQVVHHPNYDGDNFSTVEDEIEQLRSAVAALAAVLDANPVGFASVGDVKEHAGTVEPPGWMFCYGQSISRTTYAALFAAIGTTYGSDDAATFKVPDIRGRVVAGQDDMGGSSANRLTNQSGGLDGDTLGAVGGAETHTLTAAQAPANMTGSTSSDGAHTHSITNGGSILRAGPSNLAFTSTGGTIGTADLATVSAGAHTHTTTVNPGGGAAHNNVQPTIVLNKIIFHGVVS